MLPILNSKRNDSFENFPNAIFKYRFYYITYFKLHLKCTIILYIRRTTYRDEYESCIF